MEEQKLIKAVTYQDCDLIASFLQDAIFYYNHHSFHEKSRCLRLLLNRFCWENHKNDSDKEECYFRVHCGLYIHNITEIIINEPFKKNTAKFMNLLTMHASDGEINLIFSDNKHMYIKTDEICVHMRDLHAKYPTLNAPFHHVI